MINTMIFYSYRCIPNRFKVKRVFKITNVPSKRGPVLRKRDLVPSKRDPKKNQNANNFVVFWL